MNMDRLGKLGLYVHIIFMINKYTYIISLASSCPVVVLLGGKGVRVRVAA